ncbi:MAG: integrase core domain-containing protein [Chloroflexota bacterium]
MRSANLQLPTYSPGTESPYAPKANAICERFISSVHCEWLHFVPIMSEAQARRILREYVTFFNRARPHQGIDQHSPVPAEVTSGILNACAEVIAIPNLSGLQRDYRWAA